MNTGHACVTSERDGEIKKVNGSRVGADIFILSCFFEDDKITATLYIKYV